MRPQVRISDQREHRFRSIVNTISEEREHDSGGRRSERTNRPGADLRRTGRVQYRLDRLSESLRDTARVRVAVDALSDYFNANVALFTGRSE